jgi:hypothetical protein
MQLFPDQKDSTNVDIASEQMQAKFMTLILREFRKNREFNKHRE